MQALLLVKKLRPDVKIYIYGSDVEAQFDFDVENLHIINIEKCNELYNKCTVGLCISASNPSRIPFEIEPKWTDAEIKEKSFTIPSGRNTKNDSTKVSARQIAMATANAIIWFFVIEEQNKPIAL